MSLQLKSSLESEMEEHFLSGNIAVDIDKPCIPPLQLSIKLFKFSGLTELKYDIIKTKQILIFGENPVIIKLPMINGVEIIMPISPHHLLFIHSNNIENKIKDIIDALNKVQINQTGKYIFFREKPDNLNILLELNSSLQFSFLKIT